MSYKRKYVQGAEYAFYNNSDDLEDNANFASWRVDLVHSDSFISVIEGAISLTKDIISGSDYRWYNSGFTFPTVEDGCYRFVVIDTADSDNVLYISSEFEVVSSDDGLMLTKYRNAQNILNYNYTTLTTFYNKAHVEMFNRKPSRPVNTEGYSLSSGTFKRVRTILTKTYEFVTGWFDELAHDATQAMIIHSDLQIKINNQYEAMELGEDGEYTADWQENYEYVEASFRLQEEDRSSSNKAV